MSHQHWELLAKITTGQLTDLSAVCQGLAREADAERLFCVVSSPRGEQVLAIDCDGYPLGFAAERLADGGLSDLVLRIGVGGLVSSEPQVVRRVSRVSKRTVIAAKLRVSPELGVSLILENRFAGEGLASFDDAEVVHWLLILALVARLNAVGEQPARPVGAGSPSAIQSHTSLEQDGNVSGSTLAVSLTSDHHESTHHGDPEPDARQRADTLGALHQEHWNISRAARRLGMTRHGLKKRMRRLSLLKIS